MKTYLGLGVFESGTRCSLPSAYVSGSLEPPSQGSNQGESVAIALTLSWSFHEDQFHVVLTTQQLAFTPQL